MALSGNSATSHKQANALLKYLEVDSMNNYAKQLRKYNDFKALYIRNGMNGVVLEIALKKLANKPKI